MDIKQFHNMTTADGQSGKELASLLKKMQKSETPEEYLQDLIPMLMGEVKLTAMACPFLADMAVTKGNLIMAQFIAETKIRMMLLDLDELSEEELDGYLTAIHKLQLSLACIVEDAQWAEWREDFKTVYFFISLMLHSFSEDIIAFGENLLFDNAFHVTCPHCKNNLHSLYISTKDGQTSNIMPAALEGKEWDGLYFDDILTAFSYCFEKSGETYLTKLFPYLYGTYTCSKCKKESVVMDAVKEYVFEKAKPWKPSEKHISRVKDLIDDAVKKSDQRKAWFLVKYAVSLYKSLYGEDNLDGHILALETGCRITAVFGFKFPRTIAKKALEAAQRPDQPKDRVARIYYLSGVANSLDFNGIENQIDDALLYFKMAEELYTGLYGEESPKVGEVKRAYAHVVADYGYGEGSEKDLQPLLKELESLEKKDGDQEEAIANLHHLIAEQYLDMGEYEKAIEHDLQHLAFICREYGEDSDIAADYTREIGEFYQEAGNLDKALEFYEKAMDINIREMGKQYLLPPLLRNVVHGALKVFNAAKGDIEMADRAISASESFLDIGNIQMEKSQYKKALKSYQKAWELYDWVTPEKLMEGGNIFEKIGEAYEALEDLDNALDSYSRALHIYTRRIAVNEYPSEVVECQENLEMLGDKMEAFIEKLDDAQKKKIPALYYDYHDFLERE